VYDVALTLFIVDRTISRTVQTPYMGIVMGQNDLTCPATLAIGDRQGGAETIGTIR
jgi:hypothetical protein